MNLTKVIKENGKIARVFSAEARERMSAGQKARYAAVRAAAEGAAVTHTNGHMRSDASRARMSAGQKARREREHAERQAVIDATYGPAAERTSPTVVVGKIEQLTYDARPPIFDPRQTSAAEGPFFVRADRVELGGEVTIGGPETAPTRDDDKPRVRSYQEGWAAPGQRALPTTPEDLGVEPGGAGLLPNPADVVRDDGRRHVAELVDRMMADYEARRHTPEGMLQEFLELKEDLESLARLQADLTQRRDALRIKLMEMLEC